MGLLVGLISRNSRPSGFCLFYLPKRLVVLCLCTYHSLENLYFMLLALIFYGSNSMVVINNVKQQDDLPKFND